MNTMVIFLGVIFHGENLDLEQFFNIIVFLYNPEGYKKETTGFKTAKKSTA